MHEDFASDADRDGAADALQAAYADGRLKRDEFDSRIGQVLQARTHGQLNSALTGMSRDQREILDAPPRTRVAQGRIDAVAVSFVSASPRQPRRPQSVSGAAARTGGFLLVCGALVTAGAYVSVPVRTDFSRSGFYGHGIPYPPGVPTQRQIWQAAMQWAHFGISLVLLGAVVALIGMFVRAARS